MTVSRCARFLARHLPASAGVLTLILFIAGRADASKQLAARMGRRPTHQANQLPDIEQRLRPFLQARVGLLRPDNTPRAWRPTQEELFSLARSWSSLSDSFKTLYTSAVRAAPGNLVYTSPGGHFDILYQTSGIDRVDLTDTYGYATADWRQRVTGANGIPDYVDQVAWACDSSWAMEVERFGFPEPFPFVSAEYPSDRYKVSIVNLDSTVVNGDTLITGYGLYGQTFWMDASGTGVGFSSRFELRNNWNGWEWRDVAGNDYEANPEDAVHITCAHEFFHALQYAMTHYLQTAIDLDDFPGGWIEASAVLMEELGFDPINDYVQYCGSYFQSPQSPLFSEYGYGSSVAAIYLYEQEPHIESIDYIRTIFLNNYDSPTAFHSNLETSAQSHATRWRDLLNGFHAESFFTGTRSDSRFFIKDAALLPRWGYDGAQSSAMSSDTIRVSASAMDAVSRLRAADDDDTLLVQVSGRRLSGRVAYDDQWGARVLLRRANERDFDTMLTMQIHSDGRDTLRIVPWSAYDEALVVVSNAHESISGEAVVTFDSLIAPLPVAESMPLTLSPNPVHLRTTRALTITGPRLKSARIYSVGGNLMFHHTPAHDTSAISWQFEQRAMRPGTYIAVIERYDTLLYKTVLEKRKILLLP